MGEMGGEYPSSFKKKENKSSEKQKAKALDSEGLRELETQKQGNRLECRSSAEEQSGNEEKEQGS